ncbi:ABC transporter permease [Streptomyces sp. NPDC095613]|uniref:ABC transporter permease n=1 Tax=Streptomyces sp. NPDC095613 TaxID=3155540 RepID=UPI00331E62CA
MSRAEPPAATAGRGAKESVGVDPEAGVDPQAGAGPGAGGGRDAGTGREAGAPVRARRPWWTPALVRSELTITFRRWRTAALLAVLAAVPVLIGIAVRIETGGGGGAGGAGGTGGGHGMTGGGGPAFLTQVTNNGLFLVFAALAATLPVFLPMAVGVIAGDAVAGEAGGGTLRYLLVAPAGRTRLLLAKFVSTLAFCLAATLVVAASALAVGALLFPLGEVTTISGTRISFAEGLIRAALIAVIVAASLAGVAALGLFVSTLTGSGIAAMAATVGLVITAQIVDTIPQLHAIQPYLFPHYWLSFADLLREPVHWEEIGRNLGLQGLYVAVFGSAAWARFTTKDITS